MTKNGGLEIVWKISFCPRIEKRHKNRKTSANERRCGNQDLKQESLEYNTFGGLMSEHDTEGMADMKPNYFLTSSMTIRFGSRVLLYELFYIASRSVNDSVCLQWWQYKSKR
jgi:hypothetical protein